MNPTDLDHDLPAADEMSDRPVTDAIETPRKPRVRFQLQFDEHGHAISPTEEERAALAEAWKAGLAAMAAIPDDPNEPDEVFWRAMDEGRPDCPLFREFYEK